MTRVLGIDTSCYRTSLALVADGVIVAQKRPLLAVAEGERGQMQSKSLFQHVQRLPGLTEELMRDAGGTIDAVAFSEKPRPVEGSYMPVFTAGECVARSIAAALSVPCYPTTHQQGHIRAARVGQALAPGGFLALHLSGGTTEALDCGDDLSIRLVGGSDDLNAGQLVDRVGVRLGLGFPAGPALEELASRGEAKSLMPTSVRGLRLSFSGAEAQAMRLIDSLALRPEDAAAEVYSVIARSIAKLLAAALRETGRKQVLLAGGVASSALLRRLLPGRLERLAPGAALYWADPELAGDNAAGVALIGWEQYEREGREKV